MSPLRIAVPYQPQHDGRAVPANKGSEIGNMRVARNSPLTHKPPHAILSCQRSWNRGIHNAILAQLFLGRGASAPARMRPPLAP